MSNSNDSFVSIDLTTLADVAGGKGPFGGFINKVKEKAHEIGDKVKQTAADTWQYVKTHPGVISGPLTRHPRLY